MEDLLRIKEAGFSRQNLRNTRLTQPPRGEDVGAPGRRKMKARPFFNMRIIHYLHVCTSLFIAISGVPKITHSLLCAGMAEVPSFFSRKKPNLGEDASLSPGFPKRGASNRVFQKPPSKLDTVSTGTPRSKKPRVSKKHNPAQPSSLASRVLGDIGDTVLSDNEVQAWRAKLDSEKDDWILKASCEMLIHNMDRDDAKAAQEARLSNLEKENSQLKREAKQHDKALKKAEDGKLAVEKELNIEKARFEKEVADLKLENSSLADDNKQLLEDKEKAVETSFTEGLFSYVATFLSGEPNYNWLPNFGKAAADFMAEFPSKNPELMAAKKAELAETLAKEATAEGARPGGDTQAGDMSKDAS